MVKGEALKKKKKKIPILRKYALNYLGVKNHDICNFGSNGSEKNYACMYVCVHRERQ